MLKRNYQDNVEAIFMVYTRSQSKGVKEPMAKRSPNSTNRKEQDVKPIIINDIQTAPNPTKIDNQLGGTDAQIHIKYPQSQNYSQLVISPPPRPPDLLGPTPKINTGIGPNLNFEENSPHEEGIITETYESPDKSYLEQAQELADIVDSTKLMHKYLPKQVDIDRIMDIIKRKVLKGTHLPLTMKEIQAGYLNSSFFKDLYKYMAQNILPSKKSAICKV